jgi:20S proteasome alpha/beta subunit
MKYLVDLRISRMFAVHTFVFGRSSEVSDKVGVTAAGFVSDFERFRLYISYQLHAQISFYSYIITALYMF